MQRAAGTPHGTRLPTDDAPAGAVGNSQTRFKAEVPNPFYPRHLPNLGQARLPVVPQNVRIAVVIEVADPRDAPTRAIGNFEGRLKTRKIRPLCATHIPDLRGPTGTIVPQDVRIAVPIEVTHSSHPPTRAIGDTERRLEIVKARPLCAIQIPNLCGATGTIMPQNIQAAVPIEIANTHNAPTGAIGDIKGRVEAGGADSASTIHIPNLGGPTRTIVPQDILIAVQIEVAGPDNTPAGAIGDT